MNKQFLLLRGEGFRGRDLGLSYLYFFTQEPKNRGKTFAKLKIVFCVYRAFIRCEYLESNSKSEGVQRLSDPLTWIFIFGDLLIINDLRLSINDLRNDFKGLEGDCGANIGTQSHKVLIVKDLHNKVSFMVIFGVFSVF